MYTVITSTSTEDQEATKALTTHLNPMCKCTLPVKTINSSEPMNDAPVPWIAVGPTAALSLNASLSKTLSLLGSEGFLLFGNATTGNVFVTGGTSTLRGTIYSVYQFLEQVAGYRFWWLVGDGTTPPTTTEITTDVHLISKPSLSYRQILTPNPKSNWNVIARDNSFVPSKVGGGIQWATPPGQFYTSFIIIPPEKYQKANPDWFQNGQLCWSNSSLIQEIVKVLDGLLKKQPNVNIVSVSQNTGGTYCKRAGDMAIIKETGSPSGPIIYAVNQIAAALKPTYPNLFVETLAVGYSQPPPTGDKIKIADNVIVRLSAATCNFGQPFTAKSNQQWKGYLLGWTKLCKKIYVWNFITDVSNLVMPWPDWYTVGPNVRFLVDQGVAGIYQDADTGGLGGDMQALKAWVLSKLMWDPSQDGQALISEFISGYFGSAAAPLVQSYLDVWNNVVSLGAENVLFTASYTAKWLSPGVLLESAAAWEKAITADKADKIQLLHAQTGSLPTLYVILLRWKEVQAYSVAHKKKWPYTFTTVADGFKHFSGIYKERDMNLGPGGKDCGLAQFPACQGLPWLQKKLGIK